MAATDVFSGAQEAETANGSERTSIGKETEADDDEESLLMVRPLTASGADGGGEDDENANDVVDTCCWCLLLFDCISVGQSENPSGRASPSGSFLASSWRDSSSSPIPPLSSS